MIQIDNGTVHVECRYTAKVGRANYSSEECSMTFGVTYEASGTEGELLAQAGQLEDIIVQSLKFGVGTELRLPIKAGPDGPQFDFEGLKAPAATASVAPAPVGVPAGPAYVAPVVPIATSGPAAPGQFGPPKATKEQIAVLPRIVADFGKGMATYIDQRPLKVQGLYSAKAPDFKNAVDGNDSVWLTGPNGNPNTQVHQGLAAAQQAPPVDPQTAPF